VPLRPHLPLDFRHVDFHTTVRRLRAFGQCSVLEPTFSRNACQWKRGTAGRRMNRDFRS
jgi:hypothetical protein